MTAVSQKDWLKLKQTAGARFVTGNGLDSNFDIHIIPSSDWDGLDASQRTKTVVS